MSNGPFPGSNELLALRGEFRLAKDPQHNCQAYQANDRGVLCKGRNVDVRSPQRYASSAASALGYPGTKAYVRSLAGSSFGRAIHVVFVGSYCR